MKTTFSVRELKTQLSETLYALMAQRLSLIAYNAHVETTRLQLQALSNPAYANDYRPYSSWLFRLFKIGGLSVKIKAQMLERKKRRDLFDYEHAAEVTAHEVSRLEARLLRMESYLAEAESQTLKDSSVSTAESSALRGIHVDTSTCPTITRTPVRPSGVNPAIKIGSAYPTEA